MSKILYIIVPCYNEEAVLTTTFVELMGIIAGLIEKNKISHLSKVLYVDDGSYDETWASIERFSRLSTYNTGIKLARNCGHQNALIAGITAALPKADMMITIDADLQDDIGVIEAMVDQYLSGADIVYGVRKDRKVDTIFKRKSAEAFYKTLDAMGVKTINNHADFRLMSNRAAKALLEYDESNLFIRGIVTQLGFSSGKVYYDRKERFAGETKYPLKKMLDFAISGITSMSTLPLRWIFAVSALLAILGILLVIICKAAGGNFFDILSVSSVWFVGAVLSFCIGVVGEYVGKTYIETKHRPKFLIEKDLDLHRSDNNDE